MKIPSFLLINTQRPQTPSTFLHIPSSDLSFPAALPSSLYIPSFHHHPSSRSLTPYPSVMLFQTLLLALLPLSLAKTISVSVGKDGLLFTPDSITAEKGDTVEFTFYPQSHNVIESTFDKPCNYKSGGIFSGTSFSTTSGASVGSPHSRGQPNNGYGCSTNPGFHSRKSLPWILKTLIHAGSTAPWVDIANKACH